jgi:hypothetical protein
MMGKWKLRKYLKWEVLRVNKDIEEKMDRFIIVYMMHFGNKRFDKVTCFDCEDYKTGVCEGFLKDPILCMGDKSRECCFLTNIDIDD